MVSRWWCKSAKFVMQEYAMASWTTSLTLQKPSWHRQHNYSHYKYNQYYMLTCTLSSLSPSTSSWRIDARNPRGLKLSIRKFVLKSRRQFRAFEETCSLGTLTTSLNKAFWAHDKMTNEKMWISTSMIWLGSNLRRIDLLFTPQYKVYDFLHLPNLQCCWVVHKQQTLCLGNSTFQYIREGELISDHTYKPLEKNSLCHWGHNTCITCVWTSNIKFINLYQSYQMFWTTRTLKFVISMINSL